jgi:outer membrane protein assembly factor BamB
MGIGTFILAVYSEGPQGVVAAVNLKTGSILWEVILQMDPQANTAYTYGPDSKTIFTVCSMDYGSCIQGSQGTIYAYSAADGSLVWQYNGVGTFTPNALAVTPASKTLHGLVIAGNTDGHIYAFNANTGAIYWIFEAGAAVVSTPVLGKDATIVYITCTDGVVYALKTVDGTESWSYRVGYSIEGSPSLSADGSTLFFGADDGQLYALKA